MRYNQNSGYGQAVLNSLHNLVPTLGKRMLVMNSANTDEQNYKMAQEIFLSDPEGVTRFYTSLATAYTAAESNNNDVIMLDGNSSHALATALTVSKSRIHFIGLDGGGRYLQQGAKVQNTDGTAAVFVVKNTGTRNSYQNIKFIQVDDDATSLTVYQEGGEGTYMKNCSVVFGVADNLDQTDAYEVVFGGDSCTYDSCTFGNDTLLTSAARTVFIFDQVTASQEAKSNIIKDCVWQISSSSADALFVSMAAAGDILFTNLFIRPIFQASVDSAGGVALTKAVTTANGVTKGTVNLYMPCAFNVTDLGVNGTNNDRLQVYGPSFTSGTDLVGVAPVAT